MSSKAYRPRNLVILGLLILGLVIFLMATNPTDLPVGMLVVPLTVVFFITYISSAALSDLFGVFARKPRRKRTFNILVATMVSVIMVLQTTGGLTISDIILVFLIIIISLLYVTRF